MRPGRRAWAAVLAALTAGVLAQPACARQQADEPYQALRQGRYDDAIRALGTRIRQSDADARAYRGLAQALLEVGRYAEAERTLRDAPQPLAAELANMLGEALYAQGRRDEARAAFQRAVDGRASDAVPARLNLAILTYEAGRLDEAMNAFDAFIDIYNGSQRKSADDLTAIATAVSYLGARNHQLFQDAVRAYDEAIAAAGDDPALPSTRFEPRLRMAELFLDKYDSPTAQTLFGEVLAENPHHPRALLGMASAKYFDGTPEARELVRASLEVNPNYVPARVLLARLLTDLEAYDQATAEIERALEIEPSSLDALATLAGIHYLRGDQGAYEEVRARALGLNPAFADFYNRIAELAVRQRQYAAAVTLARQAVQMDPLSWWGWGILGLNQLRTGEIDEARRSLDAAFTGDPYNPWIKNTLDLLDTFDQYRTLESDRFSYMLHGSEADLLAVYMQPLAEEAYTTLAERYDYRPRTPVRVEVYPSHADFSVRTVGLAGLGALGVAFGNVLAMDSPAAQDRDRFNWGSTLWHEITHTFTLGVTDHRVPRWLTEGLSTLEERRARPGWGDDISLEWLAAYKGGLLHPISRLNEGFVRPRFPAQVGLSYYQASLVVELIERESGFAAIRAMLRGYRDGKDDEAVFRDVLNTDPASFDRMFDEYVHERWGRTLDAIRVSTSEGDSIDLRAMLRPSEGPPSPNDLFAQLAEGRRLLDAEQYREARPYFERAAELFPDNAGALSPYRALTIIHRETGDTAAAAEALKRVVALDETDYNANLDLATLLLQLNDPAGAAAALERMIWIAPYEIDLHDRLAGIYAALANWPKAVRERQAIVALKPVDMPEALYQLALAHFNAGDRTNARRQVLRALEAAPNFVKAQELLLRLRGGER